MRHLYDIAPFHREFFSVASIIAVVSRRYMDMSVSLILEFYFLSH